ncbi:MAG: PEGA domain-containing protein [Candidatus Aminicenantes bacterium]|nr:PEGA domain-containing protein [Candidatus Aminicenantes bacterium]
MKKTITLAIVLSFLIMNFLGCATIFRGDTSKVRFNSDPEGAKVFINGEYYGQTPLKLRLKSNQSYVIEFHKEGFKPVVRNINSRVGAGWVILDVIAGMVPVVVDALTGSWYHLDQEHVNVILTSQNP